MAHRRPVPKRGKPIPPPAWGCGEDTCWAYTWQPVSAMGEYNPVDVALGDLEAHYAREHPELVEEEVATVIDVSTSGVNLPAVEEVTPDGHALAA